MARIKDVVDECLVVSTAFNDISSDTYNELGAELWEDNDTLFPFMLINKKGVSGVVDTYSRTNFPSSETITLPFYFFDTYDEAEKSTTTLQAKEDALQVIAEKYFAELRTRTESGSKGFYMNGLTFNIDDEQHSNRMVRISYEVEFTVKRESCTSGTFNY
jgi:hypothetical protein